MVQEEIESIEPSHSYDFGLFFDRSTGPVLRRHYDLARGVDAKVLTCRYDVDPARETYVEQIYWGPGSASLLHGSGFSWLLLPAFQKQLSDAAGHSAFTHPFLTFGPPRVECPPFPDPDLQKDDPDKPRSAIIREPVDPSATPEPEVSGGDLTWAEYGRVPDDFMPSLYFMDSCCYGITMEKDGAGLLTGIETVGHFNIVWPGGRGWGSDAPPAVQEDFERAEGHSFIRCNYTGEQRLRSYMFWFKDSPPWATVAYLSSRDARHHLLLIGPAIDMCPMEREVALDLHPYF